MVAVIGLAATSCTFSIVVNPIVVNYDWNGTTGDHDEHPGDGSCNIAGTSHCTLRAAIEEANAVSGSSKISFDLPTVNGIAWLHVYYPLPEITGTTDIDGGTQPGFSGEPVVNIYAASDYFPSTWTGSSPPGLIVIGGGGSARIRNLRVLNAPENYTGIWNEGRATIEQVVMTDNHRHLHSEGGTDAAVVDIIDSLFEFSTQSAIETIHTDLKITSSSIRDNGVPGAFPYAGGVDLQDSTAVVEDTEIIRNTGWQAGGIYVDWESELRVENGSWIGRAGEGNTAQMTDEIGGGITCMGNVHISNSTVEGNDGEGVHCSRPSGTIDLEVADSAVRNNSTAGIFAYHAEVTVADGQILENGDGGITVKQGSLTMTGSSVSENLDGGGIVMEGGSLDLLYSTVSENTHDGHGGGIHIDNPAQVRIEFSTVSNNVTTQSGGGISIGGSVGDIELAGITVSGNQAGAFGGGLSVGGTGGDIHLTNSTISGNQAGISGGGLAASHPMQVFYSTVAGNTSPGIGGIKLDSSVHMYSSIVADNSGPNCTFNFFFSLLSGGNNLDDEGSCNLAAPGDLSGASAQLGPLQDNGGVTFTHALLPNSPAIDNGAYAICPPIDQRGVQRPVGANCDIGAFEYEPAMGKGAQPSATGSSAVPTKTPTPSRTAFLFDSIEFSLAVISRAAACGPARLTVRVHVTPADPIASVGLFYRLEEKDGLNATPWSTGIAMSSQGDGWYEAVLDVGVFADISGWAHDALLAVQFSANGDAAGNDVPAQSEIYRQVTVLRCRPPETTSTPTRESPPQPTATPTRESPPTRTSTPRPTREPPQPSPTPTRR
jgi:hypothetical protein